MRRLLLLLVLPLSGCAVFEEEFWFGDGPPMSPGMYAPAPRNAVELQPSQTMPPGFVATAEPPRSQPASFVPVTNVPVTTVATPEPPR